MTVPDRGASEASALRKGSVAAPFSDPGENPTEADDRDSDDEPNARRRLGDDDGDDDRAEHELDRCQRDAPPARHGDRAWTAMGEPPVHSSRIQAMAGRRSDSPPVGAVYATPGLGRSACVAIEESEACFPVALVMPGRSGYPGPEPEPDGTGGHRASPRSRRWRTSSPRVSNTAPQASQTNASSSGRGGLDMPGMPGPTVTGPSQWRFPASYWGDSRRPDGPGSPPAWPGPPSTCLKSFQ